MNELEPKQPVGGGLEATIRELKAELAYVRLQRDALLEMTWLDLPDEPSESTKEWRRLFEEGWVRRAAAADSEKPPLAEKTAFACSALVVPHGWSVKPLFAWYDLWVGIFWDSRKRKLYILPLPCVGVVIEFPVRHNEKAEL